MNWTVLHVKPRCEKKMADYCQRNEVPCMLPLRRETKVYQRRKVTVDKPVFPSYVFAEVPRLCRETVLRSGHVVRVIEVLDQDRLIRELEQVKLALSVDPTLGATIPFQKGKIVKIKTGPFRGLEGVVMQHRSGTRVVLNVDAIGQGVVVDLEMQDLEPA